VHKQCQQASDSIGWFAAIKKTRPFYTASVVLTFHLVCIGWVFFRAETFTVALEIIRKLLFIDVLSGTPAWALSIVNTTDPVIFMLLPFIVAVLFGGQIIAGWLASRKQPLSVPLPFKAAYIAAMICLLLVFSPDTSPKFIYFQF
jgi:alginate O-acetyltransferase complex protein AlgI